MKLVIGALEGKTLDYVIMVCRGYTPEFIDNNHIVFTQQVDEFETDIVNLNNFNPTTNHTDSMRLFKEMCSSVKNELLLSYDCCWDVWEIWLNESDCCVEPHVMKSHKNMNMAISTAFVRLHLSDYDEREFDIEISDDLMKPLQDAQRLGLFL